MYRTQACPYCVAAEALLVGKGVALEQVFLDDHPDRRSFLLGLKPGHRTVPLVVIDGTAVGGFDDLEALDAAGRLDALLGI